MASSKCSAIKLTNWSPGNDDGVIICPVGDIIRGPPSLLQLIY